MYRRKKAIFSIFLGLDPAYKYSDESIKRYAERVGADYIRVTSPKYNDVRFKGNIVWTALFQKVYFKDLLKQYDSVLYLDADLLVTPDAVDVFREYGESMAVHMLNEGHRGREKAIAEISELFGFIGEWGGTSGGKDYFNAGVIFANRESTFGDHIDIEDCALSIASAVSYLEQSYLNLIIQKNKIKVVPLEVELNYMENVGSFDKRFMASFVHYAGNGFRNKGQRRYHVIRDDFFYLYGKPAWHQRLKCIFVDYLNYKHVSFKRNFLRIKKRIISAWD